jgi:hypothetical protein
VVECGTGGFTAAAPGLPTIQAVKPAAKKKIMSAIDLLAVGLSVRRINPNKLRQFARARGVLAKNDRLDARLIAETSRSCRHELCSGTLRSKNSPRS